MNHDKLHGGVRSRTQPPQQQPPPRPQPFSSSLKFVHVDELEKYTSSNGSNMQVEPDGNYDDNVVATWIGNNNGSGLEFTGDQLDYGRGEGGGGVYEHVKVDQLSSLPAKNNSSRIVTSPATRTIQEDTREKDDLDRFILESPLKRKRTTSIIKPTTDSEDDEDRNSSGEAPDAPAQESPTNQTRLQDKKKGNMVVLNNNTSSSSSHSLVVMMRSNQPLFYTPTNEDDVASYRNIFVKHTMDAMMLFQACRMGRIALVGDRLNERNRELIESGCVYIYENAPGSKIRRWVDGKSWSSSKVKPCIECDNLPQTTSHHHHYYYSLSLPPPRWQCAGNFFIYHELSARIPPSKVAADNNGSNSSSSLFKDSQGDLVRVGSKGSFTYKAGGLIKKTMSATVDG